MSLYVKFVELECKAQNEPHGDEPYLVWKAMGSKKTIWGPTPDNQGTVGKKWDLQQNLGTDMAKIPLFPVDEGGTVELWEYDSDTSDDFLGFKDVEARATSDNIVAKLRGDDAEYLLTYKVIDA